MSDLQFLKDVQEKITKAETSNIRNNTLLEEGMKAIKKDFNCDSLEELEEKIDKTEAERDKKKEKFDSKVAELKSKVE